MTKIRHDSNTQIRLDEDDLYEMLFMGYVTIKENESCSYTLLANAEDFEKAYEEYSKEKNNPETELYYITHPDDEREDEKKYYVKVFKGVFGYLNVEYDADGLITYDRKQNNKYQTQFTKTEIAQLKRRDDIPLDWDKVKLIEVDDEQSRY